MVSSFEALNRKYAADIQEKQRKIEKLSNQVKELKTKVKQFTEFLGVFGLIEKFAEFIRSKTLRERLEANKMEVAQRSIKPRARENNHRKQTDIAL